MVGLQKSQFAASNSPRSKHHVVLTDFTPTVTAEISRDAEAR